MNGKLVSLLKILFMPVALLFLVYFAWVSRDELSTLVKVASPIYLGGAVIVWVTLHALSPLLAAIIFRGCGSTVSWYQAFETHAARLPARYLPGGIWHTVGRVLDYREQGISTRHISAFVVLENGLAAATTLAAGGAIILAFRTTEPVGAIAGVAAVVGIAALPVLLWAVNRRVLQGGDQFSSKHYALSLCVVLLFWAGAAAAFLLYLNAFPAATGEYSSIEMTGIYLFSWGVGFIAIFAPQGIGIFELVASELMQSPIGFMGLAALIAGFRVVVLLADLLVWSIYLATRRGD